MKIMEWEVRYDPDFLAELAAEPEAILDEVDALAGLRRPRCDTPKGSKYANMKELRFTLPTAEWRIAFAFDPARRAILLVGSSKSGTNEQHFYRDLIRVADRRFDKHLRSPKTGG